MSFAKHGIADQGVELARKILALSALGLFAKLLRIDVGQLQLLGVPLDGAGVSLIPGFIGLALIYTFAAFLVSRLEASVERQTDKATVDAMKTAAESKPLMIVMLLALPVSIFVYSLPYVLGGTAIALLWSDSLSVLESIWALAVQ